MFFIVVGDGGIYRFVCLSLFFGWGDKVGLCKYLTIVYGNILSMIECG